MKSLQQRLEELKNELEPHMQSRVIFLLNPKDTKLIEAVVAWTALPKPEVSTIFVDDDATMEELWEAVEPDAFNYAILLGTSVQNALPRMKQLKGLGIIYPDGSVASYASSIVNVYIKNQIVKILPKDKQTLQNEKSETQK